MTKANASASTAAASGRLQNMFVLSSQSEMFAYLFKFVRGSLASSKLQIRDLLESTRGLEHNLSYRRVDAAAPGSDFQNAQGGLLSRQLRVCVFGSSSLFRFCF